MKISITILALPLLAQHPATFDSSQKETVLVQEVSSEIRRSFTPLNNAAVEAYVNRIGADLLAHLDGPHPTFSFEVVVSKDVSEPIPLPDGSILVPTSFFLAVRHESEFAGMLAHCIGHIALHHASRPVVSGTPGIPILFVSAQTGSHVDSHQPSLTLIPLKLLDVQRGNELEADRFGLELIARAGYDPAGVRNYMERAQAADSEFSPLPPRETRLASMDEIVKALPTLPLDQTDDFEAIRLVVREAVETASAHPPTLLR